MYNFNTVNNTTGEVTTYTWDCNNRLLGVNTAGGEEMRFVYDSAGMLIREEASGVERRIVQRGTYGIREQVRSGQDIWENSVYHIPVSEHTSHEGRDGQILASYISPGKNRPDGGAIFYHPDHLGSVRLVTDEAGRIIDRTETDAYGSPLPHTTNNVTPGSQSNKAAKMLQPLNYTGTLGIRYVEKIRMHNMRARWHHPQTARFTSMDKLFATNRYNYVAGNPVMMVDPMGMHYIRYDTVNKIEFVEHTHVWENPISFYAPLSAFPENNNIFIFNSDHDKFKDLLDKVRAGDRLNDAEQILLLVLNEKAMKNWNKIQEERAIDNWEITSNNQEQTKLVESRFEYNMNCAGLAFAGIKTVYINNNYITHVQGLLRSNYDRHTSIKTESLLPGDVILESPNIIDNSVMSFTHVRTVVSIATSGTCNRVLLYEVDGTRPVVVTYLKRKELGNESVVFRPSHRIKYITDGKVQKAFPWETFSKSISQDTFRSYFMSFLNEEFPPQTVWDFK